MELEKLMLEINQIADKHELRILRNVVSDRLKVVGHMVKYSLDRGDIVMIEGGRKIGKEEGTIVKVNRTRAVVNINGKEWNVPFSMITKQ